MVDVFHIVGAVTHQKPIFDLLRLLRLYLALSTISEFRGSAVPHRLSELASLEFAQRIG